MEVWNAVVAAYLNAWNCHDVEGIVAVFAEGGTYQDSATQSKCLSGKDIGSMAQVLFDAFPDLQFESTELHPTGDDGAVFQWIMHGTNTGPLHRLPPTGKSISVPGIDIINIRDGKIQTLRGYFDRQEFFTQIGHQVLVMPTQMGPVSFGTANHLNVQTNRQPGALSMTWIDLRPNDDRAAFYALGREILMDVLNMEGHYGTWTGAVGNRTITLSAWSDVDAVQQIHRSRAHQKSAQALFDSYGEALGTSVWVPHHLNSIWVRCDECGKMNDHKKSSNICKCGANLSDVPGYL